MHPWFDLASLKESRDVAAVVPRSLQREKEKKTELQLAPIPRLMRDSIAAHTNKYKH